MCIPQSIFLPKCSGPKIDFIVSEKHQRNLDLLLEMEVDDFGLFKQLRTSTQPFMKSQKRSDHKWAVAIRLSEASL